MTKAIAAACLVWTINIAFAQGSAPVPVNGGFEDASADEVTPLAWSPEHSGKSVQTWETGGHSGQHCVAIEQFEPKDTGSWTSEPTSLQPNTDYVIAVWYKCRTDQLGPPEVLIDGNDFYLESPIRWTRWTKRFRTKPDTISGSITLWMNYRVGQKAYFDDVSLWPADRFPWPESPENGALLRAGEKPILRWSSVRGATGYRVELRSDRGDGEMVEAQVPAALFEPLEALSQGKWSWCVTAVVPAGDRPAVAGAYSFVVLPVEPRVAADTTPPLVWDFEPVRDGLARAERPRIAVRVSDDDTPADELAVNWWLDGQDQTGGVRRRRDRAWIRPRDPLGAGRHVSEVYVRDDGGNVTWRAWAFVVGERPPSIGRFDEDLALRFNEVPFFPLGLYSYAHQKHLDEIQRCGMNTILSESRGAPEYLDRLHKHNLKILVQARGAILGVEGGAEIRANASEEGRLTSLRDHPGLLGYWTDEAEGEDAPVEQMLLGYNVFKELDPYHPFMACLWRPEDFGPYSVVADGVIPDPYPSPHAPMTMVSDHIDLAVEAVKQQKPVWVIPQAFDWHVASTGEVAPGEVFRPTGEEMRCMTYLALLHGAKGVLYWASDSGKCDIVNFPDRWESLQQIAAEIAWLSPILERPKSDVQTSLMPEDSPIHVGVWQQAEKCYVLTVNPEEEPFDVTIALPSSVPHGTAKVIFENRLVPANGAIRDVFRPFEVHVYLID